jgi:NAD(P)H-dependent flavin oxidoreductase YrpB (nitropropane dioxygenase family)
MTITSQAMSPAGSSAPVSPAAPSIIQGGMGVGISGWELAAAVSRTGQLGVVSGTALEIVCTRRLQQGDPGGHMRRALAAFPVPQVAEWIMAAYFVEGGIEDGALFRSVPRFTLEPAARLQELTVFANFAEVYLAKEGHDGLVGINFLRKIEMPLPASLYGAMLAGVDYVLMGAGNPGELPGMIRSLARHEDVSIGVKVQGSRSSDGPHVVTFSPTDLFADGLFGAGRPFAARTPLAAPQALAIIASTDLAAALAGDPATRPDGFIVEGSSAGGHNAPPRGPRRTDEVGQPVYDQRDDVDVPQIVALRLPVWLAGSCGTPEALLAAHEVGAAGIQVGTAFAFCAESGLAPELKQRVLDDVASGEIESRSDWRVSPTGFPFRVLQMADTLSDPAVVQARTAVCDLGMLRSAYLGADGKVGYRCPAEPAQAYLGRKGGREANRTGRICLCNALLSSAGLPQRRRNGYVEPPVVTAGSDFSTVAQLLKDGSDDNQAYSAADVVSHLLTGADER